MLTRRLDSMQQPKRSVLASGTDAAGYGRDGIRINSVCPGVIVTHVRLCLSDALKRNGSFANKLPQ